MKILKNRLWGILFFLTTAAIAGNLVQNPEFDNNLENWDVNFSPEADGIAGVDSSDVLSGANSILFEINEGGSSDWHIQLAQSVTLPALPKKTYYYVSFRVVTDSEEPVPLRMVIEQPEPPYSSYMTRNLMVADKDTLIGPFKLVNAIERKANFKIFMGTSNGVSFWIDALTITDDDPEATSVENTPSAPNTIELLPNFPNPFNPTTTIQYKLNSNTETMLVVYNSNGQIVRTLVNGLQTAGSHSVVFDCTGLPSGNYYYRLITSTESQTAKMLIVK